VGALESLSFPKLYGPSSHGPTAYGLQKPDLVAPGGGVLSTVPAVPGEQRDSALFKRESGSSVAAAVVAGAVAVLIEKRRREGKSWVPEEIREELLSLHVRRLDGQPPEAVGAGGLDLFKL
jgi:subtilisin family serine protease